MQQKKNKKFVVFQDEVKEKEINLNQQFKVEKPSICSTQWYDPSIRDTLKDIQEWRCLRIDASYLDGNKNTAIIKDIEHIGFPHLQWLNIWSNNIVSIEGITRIRMPNLIRLWISTFFYEIDLNNIHSLRPLRKSTWGNLQGIDASKEH